MAENKGTFIAYYEWKNVFNLLQDDEAGRLVKHLLAYVNDENPTLDDRLLNVVFEPIKLQLKRDLKRYEAKIELASNSGRVGNLKRWNTALYNLVIANKITLEQAENIAKDRPPIGGDRGAMLPDDTRSGAIAKIAVNDNVNVDVNVNVKKTNNKLVGKQIIDSSPYGDGRLHFLCIEFEKKNKGKYPKEFYQSFLEYWTAKIQNGKRQGEELWRTEKTFTLGGRLATSFRMTWGNKPINGTEKQKGKIQTQIENSNEAMIQLLQNI